MDGGETGSEGDVGWDVGEEQRAGDLSSHIALGTELVNRGCTQFNVGSLFTRIDCSGGSLLERARTRASQRRVESTAAAAYVGAAADH